MSEKIWPEMTFHQQYCRADGFWGDESFWLYVKKFQIDTAHFP
jgi:hypothetical protein